jgi:hypothetical protein
VVLGDHDGELSRPGGAAGAGEPGILGADRRGEIVEAVEGVEIVKGGGDRQLVVALGGGGRECAGKLNTR